MLDEKCEVVVVVVVDVEREVDETGRTYGFSLFLFTDDDDVGDTGKLESILLSSISVLYIESTSCVKNRKY